MAGPRPLMSLLDSNRRDQISRMPQQHQGPVVSAVGAGGALGFQTLHQQQQFSLGHRQRFEGLEKEEMGRISGGGGLWNVATHDQQHQQHQRVLAVDALRQRRANNTIQSLPTLANSLIRQGPGPGVQRTDWDGGGVARHGPPMSRGRMDRTSFLADEQARLRQQQSVVNLSRSGGEFGGGINRDVFGAGLRLRESREEILNNEFVNNAMRSHANLLDKARVDMSRAYQRPAPAAQQQQQQILDPLSRNRGLRFGHEENGHAELIARYGDRSSSRNLERAHDAIGHAYQLENLTRKRMREEEADLDNRERLIRHRRLSGIDSSPRPHVRSPPRGQLKSHLELKERKQDIQQHKAKYSQIQNSEPEEREEGQLTPPKPQQHGTESKPKVPKLELDVMEISSRPDDTPKSDTKVSAPRNQTGSAFPSSLEFLPSSRPRSRRSSVSPTRKENEISVDDSVPPGWSKAVRENATPIDDESAPPGYSKEPTLPPRGRLPSPPRYKKDDRMLQRLDRSGAGLESNSILGSGLSDLRNGNEGKRESLNHASALNSLKSASRGGPHHHKKEQQVGDGLRKDLRSLDARSHRSGGAEHDSLSLDRLRKERMINVIKRKNPRTPVKDSRLVGEMTISVQKHGQRIVKVEDFKVRDSQPRVPSQINKDFGLSSQRGGGPDNPFPVSNTGRDRVGVTKRKEYEGRPPATPQEKTSRSNPSKVSGGHYAQHLERNTLQDRLSPYFQRGKDELVAPSQKYEPEPHRTPSIFTRLAGLRPETNSSRTPAETKRIDTGLLPVHDKPCLPSSSRKSPTSSQTSARNEAIGSPPEFPGFQISTRSRSSEFSREFDNAGLRNLSRKNSAAEPCDRPNKGSQKGQAQDGLIRNESDTTPKLESVVARLSQFNQKIFSPVEQDVEVFQKDLRLSESLFKTPDQSKSRQDGVALPSVNSAVIIPRLLSSELGAVEGREQSPGYGLKVQPKVIATGHRKDQVAKKSFLNNTEQAAQRSSTIPVEAVIPLENSREEKCEGRTSVLSAEGLPGPLECRVGCASLNSKGEWLGTTISVCPDEDASPQSDLRESKPLNIDKPSEVFSEMIESLGTGSTPPTSSGTPTVIEASKVSGDIVEFEQPIFFPAVEIPSPIEGVRKTVVSELQIDGDTESGLAIVPLSSSAQSTPKEVRLFGANLNAHKAELIDVTPTVLDAVERSDLPSKAIEPVDNCDVGSSTLPAEVKKIIDCTAIVQGSEKNPDCVSVQKIMDCTAIVQGSEKDQGCVSVKKIVDCTAIVQGFEKDQGRVSEEKIVYCTDIVQGSENDQGCVSVEKIADCTAIVQGFEKDQGCVSVEKIVDCTAIVQGSEKDQGFLSVEKIMDCTAIVQGSGKDQRCVSEEKIMDCTAIVQGSEKDVCALVGQTRDEQLSHLDKAVEVEQTVLICNDALQDPKSNSSDLPLVHVEESRPPPQEQHLPLPQSLNATVTAATTATTLGGQLSSTHAPGARTWHRGTSNGAAHGNNTNVFRGTSSVGVVMQSAGRSRSDQSTGYVRKGNSLVRAPGAANVPSANDSKALSVMSGQTRPLLAAKLPLMKPVTFRNTFIANPPPSKSYFSTSRKYVATFSENDGAILPSARPVNPPKIPNISNDFGKSQPSLSAIMKTLPQAAPQALETPLNSSTLLISHQEHQTGVTPSAAVAVVDRPDLHLGETSVSRTIKDTSSCIQSTDVTFMPGNLGSRIHETPGIANRFYVRRKANQLVVAPAQNTAVLSVDAESVQPGGLRHGQYFKRKTNQLVRSISGKGSSSRQVARSNLKDGQGVENALVSRKMRRAKVLRQKKDSPGRSSWVWTLNGSAVGHVNNSFAGNWRTGPSLFPWKRQNNLRTPVRSQKLRPLPEVKKGSFLSLMSKRLRKVRAVQPVYTRSADGFSLRRSGVMSLGGGNLKWTKSLEKRAKQASEEVTKAVAEAERRKREEKDESRAVRKATRGEGERIVWVGLVRYKMDAASKTLQRIPDAQGEAGDTDMNSSKGWAISSPLLTPRRSIIGGTVYLRVGNGNQLVRDPKAASRALASEKVRWSLHNARSRRAKKQQYCQFFTKFGKCYKESGKCPYIHDPEKVAVCTKFLKGNCTDVNCLLTHKVIPERMPDCSYFLEGLCTNENCPYRHVNVNPKAPYCEGFLRGYCKDGDKCNKKHRYVCSVYAETGECPDRSTCKFHHPKKKAKSGAPVSAQMLGTKRKRRYFSDLEPQSITKKMDHSKNDESSVAVENGDTPDGFGSMEFISLSNIESDEEQTVMSSSQPWPKARVPFTMKEAGLAEEMEKWIKPTFLLQMTPSTAAAAQ